MPKVHLPSSSEQAYQQDIDKSSIFEIEQRFLALNAQRLQLMKSRLRYRQREFLALLPLTLHQNHPLLPGWISQSSPCGIINYQPDNEKLREIKHYQRGVSFVEKRNADCDILGLYLIGSTGTIAQNEQSDLDIWVIYRESLSQAQVDELQHKLNLINKWGNNIGADVHCFLMSTSYFKSGKGKIESSENCGSAQHFLLLDEFYRTGLLLAGLYPLWWIVPPVEEKNYSQFTEELFQKHQIQASEYIDFGCVRTIPADEFLGAALWQLNKAIESPYKSVLKILLMEYYASSYPTIKPLCLDYKEKIYAAESRLIELDPYVMVYRCIEAHLKAEDSPARLETARRCFYLKVGFRGISDTQPDEVRKQLFINIISNWRWSRKTFEYLDKRKKWRAYDVIKEREDLMNELNYCYQFISKFSAYNQSIAHISYEDLTLLGRKLFASFERKPGKIEFINPGITEKLTESRLAFHHNEDNNWTLCLFDDDAKEVELKSSSNIVELIVWAVINDLYDMRTQVKLDAGNSGLELGQLINALLLTYHQVKGGQSTDSSADFSELAHLKNAIFIVNMGSIPLGFADKKHVHTMGEHVDPFYFGERGENLVKSIDLVVFNSWDEVYLQHFSGGDALVAALLSCINQLDEKVDSQPSYRVWCYYSKFSESIKRRLNQLINDIFWTYFDTPQEGIGRYVLNVGKQWVLIESDDSDGFTRQLNFSSEEKLFSDLAFPQGTFTPLMIDAEAKLSRAIKSICKFNRKGVIQLFYRVRNEKHLHVYVLDENGCLFRVRDTVDNLSTLLTHYLQFIDRSLLKRQAEGMINAPIITEVYELLWQPQTKTYAFDLKKDLKAEIPKKIQFFEAVGRTDEENQLEFDFYCQGEHFRFAQYGERIYQHVADKILEKRSVDNRYPVYISDLELPLPKRNKYLNTCQLLKYKTEIEKQINKLL